MLRIEHPNLLYLLGLIPICWIVFMIYKRWWLRSRDLFASAALFKTLAPTYSSSKPWLKLILFSLALALLIIGAANPQIGTKFEEVDREGTELIIALDLSNSMNAEDIKPSRLERARQSISRLIDKLENDRIGLIIFAGKAYVQLPITTDYGAAKLFLNTVNTNIIPTQGTAIGEAINSAMTSFAGSDNKYKNIIVITDGENHEDDAVEAAKKAQAEGAKVHAIGMGSTEGAPIPITENGVRVDYLKDNNGNTVISRLNDNALKDIASAGGGLYIKASNSDDGINHLMNEISKSTKKSFKSKRFANYQTQYYWFLAGALLLIIIEACISGKQSKWIQNLNLFGKNENK
ncbi:MAG: hypothetical protein RIQ89_1573 [Bacteroidota bacterium]